MRERTATTDELTYLHPSPGSGQAPSRLRAGSDHPHPSNSPHLPRHGHGPSLATLGTSVGNAATAERVVTLVQITKYYYHGGQRVALRQGQALYFPCTRTIWAAPASPRMPQGTSWRGGATRPTGKSAGPRVPYQPTLASQANATYPARA